MGDSITAENKGKGYFPNRDFVIPTNAPQNNIVFQSDQNGVLNIAIALDWDTGAVQTLVIPHSTTPPIVDDTKGTCTGSTLGNLNLPKGEIGMDMILTDDFSNTQTPEADLEVDQSMLVNADSVMDLLNQVPSLVPTILNNMKNHVASSYNVFLKESHDQILFLSVQDKSQQPTSFTYTVYALLGGLIR